MNKTLAYQPSVTQALKYAKRLGYKYNEKDPWELKVGDVVEVGLDKWEVVKVEIGDGQWDITYKAIGKPQGVDNNYWQNVRETKWEKYQKSLEYCKEWKEKNAPCWW